jgi:hypothetical protein
LREPDISPIIEHVFDSEVDAVRHIRSQVLTFVEQLDPDSILASDAVAIAEHVATIGRLADAAMTLLTPRVTESGAWQGKGHTSAAEWLAALAGTSRADASDRLKASERVKELPRTQQRLRQGRLSVRQTREVADGAAADRAAEDRLLDAAERGSLGELKQEAQRTKAAADPDPAATRERIHRERRVRHHADAEGAFCMTVRGTTDSGAQILAELRAEQDRIFRVARAEGRDEPAEAYLYDALHRLITRTAHATDSGHDDGREGNGPPAGGVEDATRHRPAGSDAKIIVRIDYDALLRGHVEGGETCEIAGLGPIPVSVVKDWLDSDAFLAAVITRGVDVLSVAHLGRRFTARQRTALQWVNPTCSRLGCNRSLGLEYDHRTEWTTTRRSLASDADRLCPGDHVLKTHAGWALVPGSGKRPFVPPDDPRHPEYRPPPPDDPSRSGSMGHEPSSRAPVRHDDPSGPSRPDQAVRELTRSG